MTTVEVCYRVIVPPGEAVAEALGQLHNVYGIRQIHFNQQQLLVEYDATRLNAATVSNLLARCGLHLEPLPAEVPAEIV